MATSRYGTDRHGRDRSGVSREAIAVALDGTAPWTDREAEAAYRAASAPLSAALSRPLQRLQRLSAVGLVAATTRFDNSHRLLATLGIAAISTCAIPENESWPGVILVGCIGAGDNEQNRWFESMLDRGAIIVSSDRSAAVPAIASGLNVATMCAGRRARVAVRQELAGGLELEADLSRLVAELHPAVRLSAGHLSLSRDQQRDATILADDVLTDEPLAVLTQIGSGQLLHSVAHWWQEMSPDQTQIGQRSLASVPTFAAIGREHPAARFGWFGAASVMLTILLAGLDVALDRVAWRLPAVDITASVDGV